jgi:hypothetical protein
MSHLGFRLSMDQDGWQTTERDSVASQ